MTLDHASILETRCLHWADEAACAAFASHLAARPGLVNAVIELHGPLGAGKTTFVRHLLRALGVDGRVRSPTFTVLEPYSLCRPGLPLVSISHLDLYRFDDPREWLDAGLREVFEQPGLKLIEWPEKAAGQLPPADLRLHLLPQEDESRQVILQACSARGQELLT